MNSHWPQNVSSCQTRKVRKDPLPNQRGTWEYDDSPVDLAGFSMVFHHFFQTNDIYIYISYDHKVWDQMLLYIFPLFSHMVSICFPHFPMFPMCFPMFPTANSLIHEASPGGTCASARQHPRRRRSSPWTPQWVPQIFDSIFKIGSHRT